MEMKPTVALLDHFASLPDPRMARHRWHKLSDILVIAVCAVLCGAESYPASEDLGYEREAGLKQFLALPEGMPSHDTLQSGVAPLRPGPVSGLFAELEASGGGSEGRRGRSA